MLTPSDMPLTLYKDTVLFEQSETLSVFIRPVKVSTPAT
jgi:hypothetical protein